ncbi:MAG: hypothetical protein QOD36_1068 [Mycobacterium sp.]|jgi:hypothetical protein|nr:hypothetical protein [Mycobacterium sp.]MDT5243692.1 hypothetical protein [Mycobacterium sp.]
MVRFVVTGAAALAFVIAPTVLFGQSSAAPTAQPCYNGVLPWGPYVPSCTLPGPQGTKIRGSAPDANAIIACRNRPGCLSWYVNGP